MRYLPLLLALLIASPAWGGMAAKRMLRMQSEIGYNVSTFEGNSDNGWVPSTTNGTASPIEGVAKNGSYSYGISVLGSGTGYASIKKTITCESGNLTFWSLRNNSFSLGRVLIDGVPAWAYDGTNPTVWTPYSVAISAGSHEITFEIPNTTVSADWHVDDITVPVP